MVELMFIDFLGVLYGITPAIPGLKTVCPSNPADAKGLRLAAIGDGDPVVFCEPKSLSFLKGPLPEGRCEVPLGRAPVTRPGGDVTLVGVGRTVHEVPPRCGIAADVAAHCVDRGFDLLDAPVRRVTAPHTPVPFSPVLEDAYVLDAVRVLAAVRTLG